jgi:hypothetical protein
MLVSCSAYSSTLQMQAPCSYGTPTDFQRTTWRDITEDTTLHNHCCQNLIYYILHCFSVSCSELQKSMHMIRNWCNATWTGAHASHTRIRRFVEGIPRIRSVGCWSVCAGPIAWQRELSWKKKNPWRIDPLVGRDHEMDKYCYARGRYINGCFRAKAWYKHVPTETISVLSLCNCP